MIADLLRELTSVGVDPSTIERIEQHPASDISPVDLVLLLTRSA